VYNLPAFSILSCVLTGAVLFLPVFWWFDQFRHWHSHHFFRHRN
jgi:hypothetical protein